MRARQKVGGGQATWEPQHRDCSAPACSRGARRERSTTMPSTVTSMKAMLSSENVMRMSALMGVWRTPPKRPNATAPAQVQILSYALRTGGQKTGILHPASYGLQPMGGNRHIADVLSDHIISLGARFVYRHSLTFIHL
jgi:hypothetical protein